MSVNGIRVLGNSGFSVTLIEGNLVRKSACGAGSERLRRQISKQKTFYPHSQPAHIHVPAVLSETDASDSFSADMEFIAGHDFVQFFTEADRTSLDQLAGIVVDFVYGNVVRSVHQDVTAQVVEKIRELAKIGLHKKYIAFALLSAAPVQIPVGPCHGDLTLSNILFKGEDLYLIDFLDCYVESPIQDVVKFRQDTFFGWSLDRYHADFDRTQVVSALCYLDHLFESVFAVFVWYRRHYTLFQAINLMHIVPYCEDAASVACVHSCLDRLLLMPPAYPAA